MRGQKEGEGQWTVRGGGGHLFVATALGVVKVPTRDAAVTGGLLVACHAFLSSLKQKSLEIDTHLHFFQCFESNSKTFFVSSLLWLTSFHITAHASLISHDMYFYFFVGHQARFPSVPALPPPTACHIFTTPYSQKGGPFLL